MNPTAIVWIIFVAELVGLGLVGRWFSLRTLRWFAGASAVALIAAVTRFGLARPEYAHSNLLDSFLSGVDQVTIAFLHPLLPGKVPTPGVAGRWIIVAVILIGYRQLEDWALRRQAPELDLSAIGRGRPTGPYRPLGHSGTPWHRDVYPSAGQRQAQLVAELRFRLPTMEVRTPAILPGGTKTNALASIAEASGVSGAGMVSAILRFAGMFWPQPRLIRVRSWVESSTTNRITVLLEDAKTGLPIATKTVAGDSFNEAASMVAGYIARHIFGMDLTVPDWCYGAADGRDLGAMQLARLERVYTHCPYNVAQAREKQIEILRRETGPVRTAGIVRYELAQLLALQKNYATSLRLHALNRELQPRFYRGRYRLAMTLEMISNPEPCLSGDSATRQQLAESLNIISRCGRTHADIKAYAASLLNRQNSETAAPPPTREPPPMRIPPHIAHELLEIAAKELHDIQVQLSVRHVIWDALVRRDERAVWLPHWRYHHRQSFRSGVDVAQLLVTIRCRLEPSGQEPGWIKRKRDRWRHWQAVAITSRIAGNSAHIKALLDHPHDGSWLTAEGGPRHLAQARAWARDHMRRLAWWRSTASWQAAYNTACLYAALASAARTRGAPKHIQKDLEKRIILSLRCVVKDPESELERAFDWIDSDPDFHAIRDHPEAFGEFGEFGNFLSELLKQEYPVSFMDGKCTLPHRAPGDNAGTPYNDMALESVSVLENYFRLKPIITEHGISRAWLDDPVP